MNEQPTYFGILIGRKNALKERVWRASALWYQALLHQSETAIEKDGRARLASAIAAREAASQALHVYPGWTSSQRWFKAIEQIVIHIKLN